MAFGLLVSNFIWVSYRPLNTFGDNAFRDVSASQGRGNQPPSLRRAALYGLRVHLNSEQNRPRSKTGLLSNGVSPPNRP